MLRIWAPVGAQKFLKIENRFVKGNTFRNGDFIKIFASGEVPKCDLKKYGEFRIPYRTPREVGGPLRSLRDYIKSHGFLRD